MGLDQINWGITTGVIGIYGLPYDRYIYIESGSNETRQITLYYIKNVPHGLVASDSDADWERKRFTNENVHEIANVIKTLKEKAHTHMEAQVNQSLTYLKMD